MLSPFGHRNSFGIVSFQRAALATTFRALLAVCLGLTWHAGPSRAASIAEMSGSFTKGSTKTVDHAAWDRLLKAHMVVGTDRINRLDYTALKREAGAVQGYVAALETVDVASLDRPEQMAYWINLYNAATLRAVLGAYPVASIKNVDLKDEAGNPAAGPWKAKLVRVSGVALSLDEIENQIARTVFKDPRVHYGLNCLSVGCSNLRPMALTGTNVAAELDKAATEYVNHPRGLSIDSAGRVTASSVYEWFPDDFGGMAGVMAHLVKYGEPALKARLAGKTKIDAYAYDWALADAATAPRQP